MCQHACPNPWNQKRERYETLSFWEKDKMCIRDSLQTKSVLARSVQSYTHGYPGAARVEVFRPLGIAQGISPPRGKKRACRQGRSESCAYRESIRSCLPIGLRQGSVRLPYALPLAVHTPGRPLCEDGPALHARRCRCV